VEERIDSDHFPVVVRIEEGEGRARRKEGGGEKVGVVTGGKEFI